MSLSATIFGENSLIFKATNILGLGIPGLLHKKFGPQAPEAQVQRLGDLSRQTAKEGDPRVIVWGRVRPIGGNIIHCQKPIKRWVVTSTSSGGKGGGKKKQEQRTEHVYRTYAIGVCEGPITAFSRIWRNNKLVYDGRGTAWGSRNNKIFLRSFRLYLGAWSQMPDPTLQSIWGTGNVPAYRGTAYMVSIDEDLTDQGGMVPQWQFEVERAEFIPSTSKLYGLLVEDTLQISPPRPSNIQVKTEIVRYTLFDRPLTSLVVTPLNVDVYSVTHPYNLRDIPIFALVKPEEIEVHTVEVPSPNDFSVIVAKSPSPNNISIVRTVVRTSTPSNLTALVSPIDITVIT